MAIEDDTMVAVSDGTMDGDGGWIVPWATMADSTMDGNGGWYYGFYGDGVWMVV